MKLDRIHSSHTPIIISMQTYNHDLVGGVTISWLKDYEFEYHYIFWSRYSIHISCHLCHVSIYVHLVLIDETVLTFLYNFTIWLLEMLTHFSFHFWFVRSFSFNNDFASTFNMKCLILHICLNLILTTSTSTEDRKVFSCGKLFLWGSATTR